LRVVLDTNVLVSGLLRSGSPADLLRQAWEDQRFGLVTSEWQLDELGRVTRYPRLKKHLNAHEVGRLVGRMRRYAHVLDVLPSIAISPDPDDDPLLATAIAGEADWLVTGDKGDLLGLRKVKGVKIVTARTLTEVLALG